MPKYPIYVASRGRADAVPNTMDLLDAYSIVYTLVVEPQERKRYEELYHSDSCFVYELPENNRGISYARSQILSDARLRGYSAVWQLDDDIKDFKRNGKAITPDIMFGHFEKRLEDEENIAMISPQFQQVIWRQKTDDIVNGQCPCIAVLSRTNINDVNYDVELPICEDLDLMFKFIKSGHDCVVDNRIGMEVQKYGKFDTKVGGVPYDDWQVSKAEAILTARYPGVVTRNGEKFRKNWKMVKSWRT